MEHKAHFTSDSLEHCIRNRHSIRFFKDDLVNEEDLHECLALAQLAPSNSNIQNWRMVFASGAARDRVVAAMQAEKLKRGPNIPPLPGKFKHFRSEMGHLLYGKDGYNIAREDKVNLAWAQERNFTFFDAPVVAVITMDQDLEPVDAMSVGMFVQTFMLAMTERGLGTCLQVSVTGFPEVLRKEFQLKYEQVILCGMAIGWPAEKNKVNDLIIPRDELSEQVKILRE